MRVTIRITVYRLHQHVRPARCFPTLFDPCAHRRSRHTPFTRRSRSAVEISFLLIAHAIFYRVTEVLADTTFILDIILNFHVK